MSNTKPSEAAKELAILIQSTDEHDLFNFTIQEAESLIQQFLDEQLAERDTWISMSDKWPKEKQEVLIYCNASDRFHGRIHVARFSPFIYADGEKPIPEFGFPGFGGILATHWKPLSEAPHV